MDEIKKLLAGLMDSTYKESRNMKEAMAEDFLVNLNPFLRPAHFFKARDAMARGDDVGAMAHTIQANPILPALPTGAIDVMREKGELPAPPEPENILPAPPRRW